MLSTVAIFINEIVFLFQMADVEETGCGIRVGVAYGGKYGRQALTNTFENIEINIFPRTLNQTRSATGSHAWDDELFYKDFRPSAIPSRSSCCGKGFTTFSEIVEVVNNWLRKKERIEVINCEVILVNSFPADNVAIKETWPNTRYIRY
ncbi:hypothetical protein Anas_03611 [Armadillidium nasatum]|uniref:Uncharacterized protein n=1 Tax=Armadillidium nasatum TaxID=96803 RepID=A0A5N5TIV0_9CRUS|nr:hypothetical protein Anas_03611 [Armadillidium nasatum]